MAIARLGGVVGRIVAVRLAVGSQFPPLLRRIRIDSASCQFRTSYQERNRGEARQPTHPEERWRARERLQGLFQSLAVGLHDCKGERGKKEERAEEQAILAKAPRHFSETWTQSASAPSQRECAPRPRTYRGNCIRRRREGLLTAVRRRRRRRSLRERVALRG